MVSIAIYSQTVKARKTSSKGPCEKDRTLMWGYRAKNLDSAVIRWCGVASHLNGTLTFA